MNYFTKYSIGSAAYCFVRKPIMLSKYQVERKDSTYSDKKYRKILFSEILTMTMIDVMNCQFLTPIHLSQDISNLEIKLRNLQEDFYQPNHFKSSHVFDLLFA
jgi:hypothetical protein